MKKERTKAEQALIDQWEIVKCIHCKHWGPKEAIPNRDQQEELPCFVRHSTDQKKLMIKCYDVTRPDDCFMVTTPDFGCVLFEAITKIFQKEI